MSKEGNMEELQRYQNSVRMQLVPSDKGVWVRFSDVEEREARFQARIKELAQDRDDMTDTILGLRERIEELEGIVSGKTMYDAASVADARWREHIEGAIEVELERYKREIETSEMWPANDPNFDWEHVRVPHLRSAGDAISRVYALRSLLDSGEERECPDCAGEEIRGCSRCDGSGRASTPSPALEECTNCDGTGTRFSEVAWDDLTCGRCNGNKAVPAGSQEGKFGGPGGRRPSPSPALEGREDECIRCEPGAVCSSCVVVEGEGGSASGVTTNSEPSPGGEVDAVKARIVDLGSMRNPHWSDAENRAYGIGLEAALNAFNELADEAGLTASNLSQGERQNDE